MKAKKFIKNESMTVEEQPHGTHHWISRPGDTDTDHIITVRVEIEPGKGHAFHKHPDMEEVLYILSGQAEQWVEKEKQTLKANEAVFIPEDVVHATYNASDSLLVFLAILSPAGEEEGSTIDVSQEEPWCKLRD